jgi:sarcosine oxidase subunit gamma
MAEPIQILSPLTGVLAKGRHGRPVGVAGVSIREITGVSAIAIIARKGRATDVAAVLSRHAGAPVADAARQTTGNGLSITGTAPGQWLAVARPSSPGHVLNALRGDLAGLAAISEQGDGRILLEVSGSSARDALAKGIPIDLDASAFKVGDAAQTSASHIGLQIALVDEKPTFEITSARSTAGSLWSWLSASAGEYGFEVT